MATLVLCMSMPFQELKGTTYYYGVYEGKIFTTGYCNLYVLLRRYPELEKLLKGDKEKIC